ncbi:NGG1p interacting factor NIF3 [Planctomyces sp. SCGC AG-212-M04]|nr:NGG1p interacting factor NIF3 [Planctomyces sp. SCGC AG-212-M04]
MPSPSYIVAEVVAFLREFAPAELAESWDNVGLLVGDESWPAKKVLTCLTLTEDVAEEAAKTGAGLVVSHHPLLFKAVKRITAETSEGRTLLTLLKAGIAVYSPHTAFDSAAQGINRRLAAKLGLTDIRPMRPFADESQAGGGRFGHLSKAVPLTEFLEHVRSALKLEAVGYVGEPDVKVRTVAVACGSAAEFLEDAARHDCDVLVTGEARFHACLEARSRGVAMVLAGHYATERPAVEELAAVIGEHFKGLEAAPSAVERDPLRWSTR